MILDLPLRIFRHLASRHRPGSRPNIFLVSTPRSGSTWLLELMLEEPGTRPCNEPLDLRNRHVRKALGIDDWAELGAERSAPGVLAYLRSFSDGTLATSFKTPRPFGPYYKYQTDRTVFKLLHGGEDLIGALQSELNGVCVLLLRHPIPVSISRRILPRLDALLASDQARHFSADQLAFAEQVIARGEKHELAMLDWCLQNSIALEHAGDRALIVTYEQLVIDPGTVLRAVVDHCGLGCYETMIDSVTKPSETTSKSSQETADFLLAENVEKRRWLIEKWREKVDATSERRLMAMLDTFHIDIYRAGEVMPTDRYLLTGNDREDSAETPRQESVTAKSDSDSDPLAPA